MPDRRGYCGLNGKCDKVDWLIQYDAQKSQLTYFTANDLEWNQGSVQPNGSVKATKFFITYEALRFDRQAQQIVVTDNAPSEFRLGQLTATQLVEISRGVAGDPAEVEAEAKALAQAPAGAASAAATPSAPARTSAPAATSAPTAPAPAQDAPVATPRPSTGFGQFDTIVGNSYGYMGADGSGGALSIAKSRSGVLFLVTVDQSIAIRLSERQPGTLERFDTKTRQPMADWTVTLVNDDTIQMRRVQERDGQRHVEQLQWALLRPNEIESTGGMFVLAPDGKTTEVPGTRFKRVYQLRGWTDFNAPAPAPAPANDVQVATSATTTSGRDTSGAREVRETRGDPRETRETRDTRDAGSPAPQRSAADVFAGTLRQELQAKDARQQAMMASAAAGVRAGEMERERAVAARSAQAAPRAPQVAATVSTPPAPVPAPVAIATPSPSATRGDDRSASDRPQPQASTAGAPLSFILKQPMTPGPKARHNLWCFSGVVTVPGPAGFNTGKGWGGSEPGAVNAAIAIIQGYYTEFQQKCRQKSDGQLRGGLEGSTQYDFNTLSEPSRVQSLYSNLKSGEPESVEVSISPR